MVKGESKCEAHNCNNVKRTSPELTFHRFPKNLARARQWAIKCGRFDFLGKDKINKLNLYHSLCSLHFERDCFINDLRNTLTKSAIPTIFEPVNAPSEEVIEGTQVQQCLFEKVYYDDNTDAFYASTPSVKVNHAATQTENTPVWNGITYEKGAFNLLHRQKLCRLCADIIHDSKVINIFENVWSGNELSAKINRILPASDHVVKCDYLPQWICTSCYKKLEVCNETMDLFLAGNSKLKGMLTPMEVESQSAKSVADSKKCTKPPPVIEQPVTESVQEFETPAQFFENNVFDTSNSSLPDPSNYPMEVEYIDYNNIDEISTQEVSSNRTPSIQESSTSSKLNIMRKSFLMKSRVVKVDLPIAKDSIHNTPRNECTLPQTNIPDLYHSHREAYHYTKNYVVGSEEVIDPPVVEINVHQDSGNQIDCEIPTTSSAVIETFTADVNNLDALYTILSTDKSTVTSRDETLNKSEGQTKVVGSVTKGDFLCRVCNEFFTSMESVLIHRFKEHTQEERYQAKVKLNKYKL